MTVGPQTAIETPPNLTAHHRDPAPNGSHMKLTRLEVPNMRTAWGHLGVYDPGRI